MIRLEGVGLRYGPDQDASHRDAPRPDVSRPDVSGPDALFGLNIVMPQAGFAWVVGPTGAGKSSLLQLLQLDQPATAGRVVLLDRDIADLGRAERLALRRRIGVITPVPDLLAGMTVFESVALPLRLESRPSTTIRADVGELINWLGLAGKAAQPVESLSLGERQLVAIARAVAVQPGLLLADEPTAHLDSVLAEQVMRLLWELHLLGTTVLVAIQDESWLGWQRGTVIRLAAGRRVDHG